MSAVDNKALARRAYDALNQGNLPVFTELIAPDFVLHNASMTIQGREAYNQFISMYLVAFPDAQFTIEDLIAEGDRVVTRQTFHGTHQGVLMGIPVTGKQVSGTGIVITRIANEKAVEQWANYDDLGLMQQLGVVPAPGEVR
ncbi:MAG TPA: ester cyclase [Ktedonobacteraceae bacterium]